MGENLDITEIDVDELWLREWAEEGLERLERYLESHTAFADFLRERATAYGLTGNPHDAADLVPETFVRALPKLDSVPPDRAAVAPMPSAGRGENCQRQACTASAARSGATRARGRELCGDRRARGRDGATREVEDGLAASGYWEGGGAGRAHSSDARACSSPRNPPAPPAPDPPEPAPAEPPEPTPPVVPADTKAWTVSISSGPAGETGEKRASFIWSPCASALITAVADAGSTVAESNEGNNAGTSPGSC